MQNGISVGVQIRGRAQARRKERAAGYLSWAVLREIQPDFRIDGRDRIAVLKSHPPE